jgi:hypothetical protein
MSIQQNFPGIMPSLNLNFAKSKRLDPRVTFQRLTGATVTNELGLIERVGNNIPRFDHSYNSTGVINSLGLLIEEQRENILNRSEVTTSNWTGSTSNTTYSNLSLNALGIFPGVEVTSTTGAAWHRRTTGSNVPFVSGTQYAVTFYYREGTSGRARLQFRYNSQESYVQGPANGSAWSIEQTLGSITNVTTTLMDGQSTYKTSYIFTPNFTGVADMGIGVGLEGSPGVTIIALGGQVEVGAFPTSYIPTQGLPVTRAEDSVYIDGRIGDNFSWYNPREGSILWTGNVYGTEKQAVCPYKISNLANLRGIGPQFDTRSLNNTAIFMARAVSSNIPVKNAPFGTIPSSDTIKIAGAYEEGVGISAAFDGSPPASSGGDSQTDIVSGDEYYLDIGGSRSLSSSNNKFTGVCEQLVYYPRRVTDLQLQSISK